MFQKRMKSLATLFIPWSTNSSGMSSASSAKLSASSDDDSVIMSPSQSFPRSALLPVLSPQSDELKCTRSLPFYGGKISNEWEDDKYALEQGSKEETTDWINDSDMKLSLTLSPSPLPIIHSLRGGYEHMTRDYKQEGNGDYSDNDEDGKKEVFEDAEDLDIPLKNGHLARHFAIDKTLGVGGFGVVVQATHKLDHSKYAIKLIPFSLQSSYLREAYNMSKVPNHPNVVRCYSAWIEEMTDEIEAAASPPRPNLTEHSDDANSDNITNVNDKGGSESDIEKEQEDNNDDEERRKYGREKNTHWLNQRAQVDVLQAWSFLLQIAQGVQHIHNCQILLRDVKPENILLCSNGIVKLCDFGLSVHLPLLSRRRCHRQSHVSTGYFISFFFAFVLIFHFATLIIIIIMILLLLLLL
ncbi:hypothetical protein RFI_19747 [Reticulomyxa filosa]|uniref:non-specific serine/threonine protein kinase n=1 Tax=Reticulomyxa filosa TaxID=46433 RepID=X6MUR1_RETFI|nr:hypothetical protein RFI_19747 [Reticulomyxa filosa]|eukprot:ETO17574.1 hypothetical protein RFI_19747 [Reticulomyxa filosa]